MFARLKAIGTRYKAEIGLAILILYILCNWLRHRRTKANCLVGDLFQKARRKISRIDILSQTLLFAWCCFGWFALDCLVD